MNLKRILLALLLTAPAAHAQLTLTQADVFDSFTQPSSTTSFETGPSAALTALAEAEGAGQTWDFSALTYTNSYTAVTEVVEPPVLGSDDPHLGGADFIVRTSLAESDSVAYVFYDFDEAALSLRGVAAEGEVDGEPGVVLVRLLPASRLFTFPLSFETTWTDEYELQITPVIEQVRIEERETSEVVGWGTLITSAGSAEALMLRAKTVQTVRVVSTDPDTSFVVGEDSLMSITYVSRDGLAANIELDGVGNVELGGYSVQTVTTADEPTAEPAAALLAPVYPNPVRRGQETTLAYSLSAPGPVRIEVFDVLGRVVATVVDAGQAAGPQQAQWRSDAVPAGLYFVRVVADGRTTTQRVTVVD